MKTLYKYKSTEHIEDIIVNRRLFCSQFDNLNDPMEWAFISDCEKQRISELIKDTDKDKWRICCLSKLEQNGLMWSIYGDEHRGVCIEVEVDETEYSKLEHQDVHATKYYDDIEYIDSPVTINIKDDIKRVLWAKSIQWEHEKEVRFVHKLCGNETSAYLPIKIKHIFLGKRMKAEDKLYIERLCKAFGIDCKSMDCSDAPAINFWSKAIDGDCNTISD